MKIPEPNSIPFPQNARNTLKWSSATSIYNMTVIKQIHIKIKKVETYKQVKKKKECP